MNLLFQSVIIVFVGALVIFFVTGWTKQNVTKFSDGYPLMLFLWAVTIVIAYFMYSDHPVNVLLSFVMVLIVPTGSFLAYQEHQRQVTEATLMAQMEVEEPDPPEPPPPPPIEDRSIEDKIEELLRQNKK